MPKSQSIAHSRHQKKEIKGINKDATNATYETAGAQTEEFQHKNCLGTVSRKLLGMGVLKPVLYARNHALKSDGVQIYKYMFRPHMGPLPHL